MITGRTFRKAVRRTRLTEQSRQIARKVLVLGWEQKDAARFFGVSQPRVSAICATVLRARTSREAPEHWCKVTVVVPPDLAIAIRQAAREASEALGRTRKAAGTPLSASEIETAARHMPISD